MTPAEVKKRRYSLSRDQLLGIVDDQELFASLDGVLQTELVARLASVDPQVTVQRALDGKISEKIFNGVRLNPVLFTNQEEFASGLLQSLDLTDPLQQAIHSKVFMAGMEGAPAVVVKSLLLRKKKDASYQIGSGYKIALRQLYASNPAQAVSAVTANTVEGSAERASSLFIIGQEISNHPEGEGTLGLDSISDKDLEALKTGKTAALLRAGNASGLELLKALPNESLLSVISQQPSFAGLCKIDPQGAIDLISRIDMPTEAKGALEIAANTLIRKNKALVLDWITQQPDSEKKFAALRGSINYLEKTSAPDLEDWKKMLPDSRPSDIGDE